MRGRARAARARRRRAALAGLRVLRPVPRPSRSAATTSARWSARSADSSRRSGRRPKAASNGGSTARRTSQQPLEHSPAADGDVLPARRRRGDGLLGVVGAHAAAGPGRRHGLPRQVPDLRRARPGRRCTSSSRRGLRAGPRATRRSCCWRRVRAARRRCKLPGLGVQVNGARRWLGAGPLQFQPSELMKLALVLHAAAVLGRPAEDRPQRSRGAGRAGHRPRRRAVAADRRRSPTWARRSSSASRSRAMLVAAGLPLRQLGLVAGVGAVLVVALRDRSSPTGARA